MGVGALRFRIAPPGDEEEEKGKTIMMMMIMIQFIVLVQFIS